MNDLCYINRFSNFAPFTPFIKQVVKLDGVSRARFKLLTILTKYQAKCHMV